MGDLGTSKVNQHSEEKLKTEMTDGRERGLSDLIDTSVLYTEKLQVVFDGSNDRMRHGSAGTFICPQTAAYCTNMCIRHRKGAANPAGMRQIMRKLTMTEKNSISPSTRVIRMLTLNACLRDFSSTFTALHFSSALGQTILTSADDTDEIFVASKTAV